MECERERGRREEIESRREEKGRQREEEGVTETNECHRYRRRHGKIAITI